MTVATNLTRVMPRMKGAQEDTGGLQALMFSVSYSIHFLLWPSMALSSKKEGPS